MSHDSDRLIIFDLDYTLTRQGTWGRFTWMAVKRRPHLWLPLLISAGWTQVLYKKGKLPRIRVKRAMMGWTMVGMSQDKLSSMAEAFAKTEVSRGLKPGAILALERHKAAGDIIMIASAAVDLVVEPIAKKLGVEYFVATSMGWDATGRLEADFASENCYGDEKLKRIKAYISERPDLAKLSTIVAYSDSHADIPMLEFAAQGIVVDPKSKFKYILKDKPHLSVETWL